MQWSAIPLRVPERCSKHAATAPHFPPDLVSAALLSGYVGDFEWSVVAILLSPNFLGFGLLALGVAVVLGCRCIAKGLSVAMDGHAKVPAKRAGAARDGGGQVPSSVILLTLGSLLISATYPQGRSVNKLNTVLKSVSNPLVNAIALIR